MNGRLCDQDLLVRHKWQGVDMEDLVRTQLTHFADLIGLRIAVGGPQLHLNAAASQTLGLAIHELATNASKYGDLSTDAGRVDIDWRLDGETLAWREISAVEARSSRQMQPSAFRFSSPSLFLSLLSW